MPPLFQTIAKAESPLSFLETKRPTGAYKHYYQYHSKTGCDDKRRIVEIKRPYNRATSAPFLELPSFPFHCYSDPALLLSGSVALT